MPIKGETQVSKQPGLHCIDVSSMNHICLMQNSQNLCLFCHVFSSIIICLSCFHVMPEKNHYTEATSVLHLLLTRRDVLLCPLISQQYPACWDLSMCHSQYIEVFKLVVVEASNMPLVSLKTELTFTKRWWWLVRPSTAGGTSDFCGV